MAETTHIEWCDSTFNPWIGCTRVSPACDDCYAARSTPARTLSVVWGPGEQRRRTSAGNWQQPAAWQRQAAEFCTQHGRRRRVFCASLADWLDNEVLSTWRCDLLHLVRTTPALDWLLLSKRIGNWRPLLADALVWAGMEAGQRIWPGLADWLAHWLAGKAPANVWLGATVVDQAEANRDVPKLLATPAAVRFLSVEPMLGPVDLDLVARKPCRNAAANGINMDPETGAFECCRRCDFTGLSDEWGIDWVICGGESGPKARPMHPDWARSLRDQCAAAGVPFLLKQWGEWVPADNDCGTVVPVTEIVGDVQWTEGKRVRVQWLSPNGGIVGHSFARLGKKAAGRMLDGRTHDEVPHA